ncbi:major facilitator superfamily MFS_1 [Stanieria cyanosphaera PCC 7437]|uniref:Major facilitator superfamily MFS_1 n=1 Tax=Stanieria cyanosphaera (strain ATCC 29371 / PCC 7437) TaxID=111780 RepID=K9XU62_STAC7|nr:MFS transporter [Stanieria cyanosphaera]AFZ35217.1 major facilitator superfamily MFS_1 [Stanieria cyanosphaera PCC 7437]
MEQTQKVQFAHKTFWAIAITLFMIAYNVSVMPTIMSPLVRDLNSSVGAIQSILVVYFLVAASFAPSTENLCRFYGRTRIFSISLVLYGIGMTLTSLSPTIEILALCFSLLTGLASTPLISTPLAIADLIYGDDEERVTIALILASTLGGLFGSLLGGYLASNLGWRWAFVPSLLVLMFVFRLRRSLPNLIVNCTQPIDWIGGLLSFLGLSSIFVGMSLAGEFGWWEPKRAFSIAGLIIPPFAISIVPTLFAVGMILLGFFVFWQRRQANLGKACLFRVGLLRNREFVLGLLTAMLHTLIVTGVQFNLFQFVPLALSLNPFRTALTIIPYNLTMVIVIISVLKYLVLGNRITPKYIVCIGISLLAAGIGVLYSSLHLSVTSLELMPGLIIMGVGSGLFSSYISTLTYSNASKGDKPQASGIYDPIQNLGCSLGRGILGTALVYYTARSIVDDILENLGKTLSPVERLEVIVKLQEMLQTFSREEVREVFANKLPPSIYPLLRLISLDAATSGIKISLLIALFLTGICFLLAVTLPKYPSCRRS